MLRVTVGNGEELQCNQVCMDVSVQIQKHDFKVDFHVLPIRGANIVLGVQWLKSLGPVLTDYTTLTMKFIYDGKLIELTGDRDTSIDQISPSQLRHLVDTGNTSTYFHIQMEPHTMTSSPLAHPIPTIQKLLTKYSSLFQPLSTLPPSRPTDHTITLLPNSAPVNVRPYRYPYYHKQEIENQVASMLHQGHIQHSSSPFSSPVLLVKKRDGTWHFCVDYRALNAITVHDRFPIPAVDELLDELGGVVWFSKLDLMQGYHQILMKESDTSKTAFRTHHGQYEFRVMPFGLCNAPSSFQATMKRLFQPYLQKYIIVFFDDILIYSRNLEEHLNHLETAFQVLMDGKFTLKFAKYSFMQKHIDYLGHIVSGNGVQPIPEKVQAIQRWPQPRTTRALRGFLGLVGFYCRFIRGYTAMVASLLQLLTKADFMWSPEAEHAFQTLKDAVTMAPVLALPDFAKPFTVETDASGSDMGAVLSQEGHPIAFFSKQFCPKLLRSSMYVRELAAITAAVKKWRQYLLGHHFVILTDHRSLKKLMNQAIQTPEQHRFLARLLGFNYVIQYRAGKSNVVADALSQ